MFMSENIMLDTQIRVLQQIEKKEIMWETRHVIFTDRAVYIFAHVTDPREPINYLSAPSERLNMQHFIAVNPS